jgi:hypothetical protein
VRPSFLWPVLLLLQHKVVIFDEIPPMTHDSTCKNCGATLTGNFCANCGQTAHIHRVTFKHFLHEFFHAFTHTDKGILLLMKELMKRPGYVAEEYLEGKRKKYFNPLTFLIILSSLFALASHFSGYYEALSYQNPQRMHPMHKETLELMYESGRTINLFLMPVLISCFSWLFFRKRKNNFAENLVLNSFVMGQIYIIMIVIFIPGFLLFPSTVQINNNVFHVLMLVYLTVAYHQFFKNNIFLSALKSILITLLFIVFFWLALIGFVIVRHMILD